MSTRWLAVIRDVDGAHIKGEYKTLVGAKRALKRKGYVNWRARGGRPGVVGFDKWGSKIYVVPTETRRRSARERGERLFYSWDYIFETDMVYNPMSVLLGYGVRYDGSEQFDGMRVSWWEGPSLTQPGYAEAKAAWKLVEKKIAEELRRLDIAPYGVDNQMYGNEVRRMATAVEDAGPGGPAAAAVLRYMAEYGGPPVRTEEFEAIGIRPRPVLVVEV